MCDMTCSSLIYLCANPIFDVRFKKHAFVLCSYTQHATFIHILLSLLYGCHLHVVAATLP